MTSQQLLEDLATVPKLSDRFDDGGGCDLDTTAVVLPPVGHGPHLWKLIEIATAARISRSTLDRIRKAGQGPRPCKWSRFRFADDEVRRWLSEFAVFHKASVKRRAS